MFLTKSPTIIKKYYPELVWEVPNNESKIYLTFDDGPIPEVTEWVLDVLKQYNIKATFFCIGSNVQKHLAVFQKIINENHEIGNHTFNHLNGWETSRLTYLSNIKQCQKLVETKLFRPPYGRIKKTQAKALNKAYRIIMWDVLSGDFDQEITPQKCYNNVVDNVSSGSIIVFHDSKKAKINLQYALPKAIEYLLKQGFVFDVLV